MGNIGDSFTTAVPAVGSSGTGYASDIDDILTEVVARLSTAVPVGSIAAAQSGETLDMNGQGIVDAGYVELYTGASAPVGPPYNVLASYNGDVYWVSPAGVVQITSNGALNMASTGGLVGDYGVGGNPAGLAFVDSTATYEFYDDYGTGALAGITANQLNLVDEVLSRTTHVTSSTAIAATWTLQLPPNDPASGVSLTTINSSGAMGYADVTAVTNGPLINSDVTLQNASKIKHGSRYIQIPGSNADTVISFAADLPGTPPNVNDSNNGRTLYYSVRVERNWRIKSARMVLTRNGAGTASITAAVSNIPGGPAGSSDTQNDTGTGTVDTTVTLATPRVIVSGDMLYVTVVLPNTVGVNTCHYVEVEYDVV